MHTLEDVRTGWESEIRRSEIADSLKVHIMQSSWEESMSGYKSRQQEIDTLDNVWMIQRVEFENRRSLIRWKSTVQLCRVESTPGYRSRPNTREQNQRSLIFSTWSKFHRYEVRLKYAKRYLAIRISPQRINSSRGEHRPRLQDVSFQRGYGLAP